jgi:hypothetical protein
LIFLEISLFIGNKYRLLVGDQLKAREPHRSWDPRHVSKVPNGKEVSGCTLPIYTVLLLLQYYKHNFKIQDYTLYIF